MKDRDKKKLLIDFSAVLILSHFWLASWKQVGGTTSSNMSARHNRRVNITLLFPEFGDQKVSDLSWFLLYLKFAGSPSIYIIWGHYLGAQIICRPEKMFFQLIRDYKLPSGCN